MTGPDLLQRLHEKLLEALAAEGGSGGAITVGDIYQRLIPYRSVRGEIGVMELATYEHALLRLLAGERNLVRMEREAAADELRKELSSPNPILGIYRDYADVAVTVQGATHPAPAPSLLGKAAAADGPRAARPSAPPASPLPVVSPSKRHARIAEFGADLATADGDRGVADGRAATRDCSGCGNPLPSIAGLRFCPFCGRAPGPSPCIQCGTRLEASWNFCIRCGTPAAR